MASFLQSSCLLSIHPIQASLRLYFNAYTIGLVRYWKVEPEGQFQGQKWGVFSTVLLIRTSFYFMNRNHFIIKSSIEKDTPHPIHVGK